MKQLLYFKHHVLALLVIACGLVACTEEIDMSNRYTFTEYTVLSYLEENEQFSEYVKLLGEVPISEVSSSTVKQLLSARGAYTCFAPNDSAIHLYLDTLYRNGKPLLIVLLPTPSVRSLSTTVSSTVEKPRASPHTTPVTSPRKIMATSRCRT